MYLFIDPGKTSGFALFDEQGNFIRKGQIIGEVLLCDMIEALLSKDGNTVDHVFCESFKIFPGVRQGGSNVPAARVNGAVEHICNKLHVRYEEIDPKYKRIGYAWSGVQKPTNHAISHQWDAFALGEYWLRKNGIKTNDRP